MNPQRPRNIGASPLLLGAAVVLVAMNLRPAAASVGPVLHRIELGDSLSTGWASLLTTLPALSFGLLAPAAPLLAKRIGVHSAVAVAMCLLVAGQLIRLISGVGFLFFGTIVAGAAIAIANVLLPVIVRRDFADRAGIAMSVFSAALIGFAALAAGVTVPVADALGGGWRPGLGIWAAPAVLAAIVWVPGISRRRAALAASSTLAPPEPHIHDLRILLRSPLAWQITLLFAVLSGSFYSTLAWLPSIFRSHGASEAHAGVLLSVTLIVGIFTGLAIPTLAHRLRDQRSLVAASCLLTALGWAGILISPTSAPYLWAVLLGLGQNASFPLVLMLIVLRGGSVRATQALSAMAQSLGYALAALTPLVVGAIHGLTHSWTPDVILLLFLALPQFLLGMGAGRPRQLTLPDDGAAPTVTRSAQLSLDATE